MQIRTILIICCVLLPFVSETTADSNVPFNSLPNDLEDGSVSQLQNSVHQERSLQSQDEEEEPELQEPETVTIPPVRVDFEDVMLNQIEAIKQQRANAALNNVGLKSNGTYYKLQRSVRKKSHDNDDDGGTGTN